MTVTEDAPAAAPASSEPTVAPAPAPAGLAAVLGSGDHKVVGRLWIVAALVHLLLVVARCRSTSPRCASTPPGWPSSPTARATGSPRSSRYRVDRRRVPRAAAAHHRPRHRSSCRSRWAPPPSPSLGGGGRRVDLPDRRRPRRRRLRHRRRPLRLDRDGVRLFVVAFVLVLVAELVAWICIMTTVITLRAPGMTLARTPAVLLVGPGRRRVWLLTPARARRHAGRHLRRSSATASSAGSAGSYGRIAWAFGQPTVYAFAIPVLGFVATVVPVFSATRHHLNRYARNAIAAFGAFAIGAWAVPSFVGPDRTPWLYEVPWVAVSFAHPACPSWPCWASGPSRSATARSRWRARCCSAGGRR